MTRSKDQCACCGGLGAIMCRTCDGEGYITDAEGYLTDEECKDCMGDGEVECDECEGTGEA